MSCQWFCTASSCWAACLLPSGQDEAGDRRPLAHCTPDGAVVRWGLTPPGAELLAVGWGASAANLTLLPRTNCSAMPFVWPLERRISLDPEAYSIPCWLPFPYTSLLVTSRDTGPLGVVPGCNSSPPEAALKSSCLSVVGGCGRGLWRRD